MGLLEDILPLPDEARFIKGLLAVINGLLTVNKPLINAYKPLITTTVGLAGCGKSSSSTTLCQRYSAFGFLVFFF